MKKLLALVLSLALIFAVACAFAEGANTKGTGVEQYTYDAEGNLLKTVDTDPFQLYNKTPKVKYEYTYDAEGNVQVVTRIPVILNVAE